MISPARITAIAENTVREAVRNKILYALLFFGVLMIAFGILVSTLSYVEGERILQSVGLASIRMFGAAIAIFVGVGLIHKEVDRRTIFTILSKPVSRTEFLVGKYMGLLATLWLQLAIMGLAFALVSWLSAAPLDSGHLAAVFLAAMELTVLVAVATLFSSFTTPMLASCFTVGLYVLGHVSRDLKQLGAQSDVPAIATGSAVLYRALPDLEMFNVTIQAVHQLPLSASEVVLPLGYALCYTIVLLAAASLIFERRDLR